jgi:hypothetical protein
MEAINAMFPVYEYTFKVISVSAQSGNAGIEVKYIPNDIRLTSMSYFLPIEPNFDANNMASYVDQWAPRQQWYAQEMVLQHEQVILNSGNATS